MSIISELSTITEGLIVKDTANLVTYLPLAVDGLDLLIDDITVLIFSINASLVNETLPTPA